MRLAKQILDETDGKICKNCLGRKLSKTIEGSNNIERADKVCKELGIDLDGVDCVICDNLFDKLDDDLKKYYYDEFGLPKDATKEDFYKAFVNMYCYTPEGEYMAAVSLTTESGESIALLHLFE